MSDFSREVLPADASNPYKADISGLPGDGSTTGGYIRIEPPFSVTNKFLWRASENWGIDLEHFVTTANATVIAWEYETYTDITKQEIVGEKLDEVIDAVRSATGMLLEHLGVVNDREKFVSTQSPTGDFDQIYMY
jgi:hypothetical protein